MVVATCAVGIAAGASLAPSLDELGVAASALDLLRLDATTGLTPPLLLDEGGHALMGPPLPAADAGSMSQAGVHATLQALGTVPAFLPFPLLPGDEMLLGGSDIMFTHGASASAASASSPASTMPSLGPTTASSSLDGAGPAGASDVGGPGAASAQDSHVSSTTVAPPPTRNVAAVVAASGAALGFLGLLGVALYHRIRPTTTLENDTRKHIFDAVCGTPGLGVHAIASQAGVSYSTATYHLERLVAAGMIVMTPDGNKLCYYKNGGAFTEVERRILPLLKNDEAARLLEAILENPGTYRAALAERLGVTATTINWHLRRLREANLVQENRQGRNAYLYANVLTMQQSLPGLAMKLSVTDVAVAERIRRYVGQGNAGMSASS